MSSQLGISNVGEWYSKRTRDLDAISNPDLATILRRHGRSLSALLEAQYPQHVWQVWRFVEPPRTFFTDLSLQRSALIWLAERLSLREPPDWYRVRPEHVEAHSGIMKLLKAKYRGSLPLALSTLIEFDWFVMLETLRPHSYALPQGYVRVRVEYLVFKWCIGSKPSPVEERGSATTLFRQL